MRDSDDEDCGLVPESNLMSAGVVVLVTRLGLHAAESSTECTRSVSCASQLAVHRPLDHNVLLTDGEQANNVVTGRIAPRQSCESRPLPSLQWVTFLGQSWPK